jgi:O-antigen ligase
MTSPVTRVAQGTTLVWIATTAWSTAIAEVSLGISLACLLVGGLRGEYRGWTRRTRDGWWLLVLWAALLGWMLVDHAFAVDRSAAIGNLPKLYRFAGLLPLAVLPRDRKFESALYATLSLLTLVLAAEALPPFFRDRIDRVRAARLHYNTLAQYSASLCLILLSAAVGERDRGRLARWGMGLVAGVAALMLVGSLSRAAWAGWITALPVIVLVAVPRRRRVMFLGVSVALFLAAMLLPPVQARVAGFAKVDDPHILRRFDMWSMGGELVREYPLTGAGPSGIAARYDELKTGMLAEDPRRWPHLHNDLVTTAATWGIPAALLLVALGVAVYRLLLRWTVLGRAHRPPPLALGAALSIHVFLVCGMLHDTLPIYRKLAWYLMLWGLLIHSLPSAPRDEA